MAPPNIYVLTIGQIQVIDVYPRFAEKIMRFLITILMIATWMIRSILVVKSITKKTVCCQEEGKLL